MKNHVFYYFIVHILLKILKILLKMDQIFINNNKIIIHLLEENDEEERIYTANASRKPKSN